MSAKTEKFQAKTIFQASVLTSGLVSSEQLAERVQSLKGEDNKVDDNLLAASLVHHGWLTEYQAEQLKAGRTKLNLGPYTITDFIAQGGMGQVFKGVHKVMGRECAVKVLPLEKSTENSRNNFLHEIRLQAGLDCPYLVRAYDAGQDGKIHYLVTEYVPGTDLRRYIKQQGALPPEQAATFIRQAALGLDYAHQQGLVHRDVKPGNILVTPDGMAKVSDVGLAAWSTAMSHDPRAGKVVGTADYLSPEQIMTPANVGPASDIYSLGCTLYYCICGKVPYPGGTIASKCRRHCEDVPLHPRKFAIDVPEEFIDIVADMIEKDPNDRISSGAEVAARLEPWVAGVEALGQRPITRGPWLPDPPPGSEPISSPPSGTSNAEDSTNSSKPSQSETAASAGPVPEPPPIPGYDVVNAPKPDSSMAVAIALAIAIPFSLLVGAIIGFLVHKYWV